MTLLPFLRCLSVPRTVRRGAGVLAMFAGAVMCGAETRSEWERVVKQVDHVIIRSSHPKELFSMLSETFAFPIAWPMADFGGYMSGGVAVGNVNLEIVGSSESSSTESAETRFVGLALAPSSLAAALKTLDARGIPHGPPQMFRSGRLRERFRVLWTTAALPTVSNDDAEVFLCEYTEDVSVRSARLREELRSRAGGPLTVQSLREIVYGSTDPQNLEAQWRAILTPLQVASDGSWRIGEGPALRIAKADRSEIQMLVLNVGSLDRARNFLRGRDLIVQHQRDRLTIGGSFLGRAVIELVESAPADVK